MKERGEGRPERAARRRCAVGLWLASRLLGLALGGAPAAAASNVIGPGGIGPGFSASPSPIQFRPATPGYPNPNDGDEQYLTITNSGSADLEISSYTFAGDSAFSVDDITSFQVLPELISPGRSDTIGILFRPKSIQPYTGTIVFETNTILFPQRSVTLQGAGIAPTPKLSISPTSLDFGETRVGDKATRRSVTVTNIGPTGVDLLLGIPDSTDFRQYAANYSGVGNDRTPHLYPGESGTTEYEFQPSASGRRSAKVTVVATVPVPEGGSVPPQSFDLTLTGTGVTDTPAPNPTPSPPAVTGPTVTGYAATQPKGVAIGSGPPGAPLLILGANLGTSGSVAFHGLPAPPALSWSPSEIVVTIPTPPSYPFTGPVTVTVNGQTAAGPPFTILRAANPSPVPVVSADWPVFGHDPQQLGSTSSALEPSSLSPWSVPLGSRPGSAPVILGGVAYVGTASSGVVAIDTSSHTQRWNRPFAVPVTSAPAAGADVVAVSANGLYGLSPKDGSDLWPPRSDIVAVDGVSPMRAGNVLYLGGRGPGGLGAALYAVSAATGKDIWAAPPLLPAAALSTAAVDPGRGLIFLALGQPPAAGQPPAGPSAVVALQVKDGTPAWPSPAIFPDSPAPAGLSLGTVAASGSAQPAVFVATGSRVTALDAATGAVLWARTLLEAVLPEPPVVSSAAAGATLFVGGSSGKVYALAANTGADAAGGLAAPLVPLAGSPALAGSTLLVPTTAGLVAIDPTGAKLWSSDLPAATGVSVAGGSVYVGTTDDRLVGFSPTTAPPGSSPSPAPSGTMDVALTAIQVTPTVSRSADALVRVTLANRGGASVNYSLSLRVQPGNLLIGTTTGTLAAGETREVPFTWATGFMGADGVKVLLAQVELPGQTDSHPEDNILTQPVTVGP